MPKCDCIRGQAFVLNDEEGDAWKRPYIKNSSKYRFDENAWIVKFKHCPRCGQINKHTDGSEYL